MSAEIAKAIAEEANQRWRDKTGDMRCFDGFQVEAVPRLEYLLDPVTGKFYEREEIVYEAMLYGGASYIGSEEEVRVTCRWHVEERVKRH